MQKKALARTGIGVLSGFLVIKVNGKWLSAKRRIYTEGNAAWAAPPGNPAW
jgi:hypothetical protein